MALWPVACGPEHIVWTTSLALIFSCLLHNWWWTKWWFTFHFTYYNISISISFVASARHWIRTRVVHQSAGIGNDQNRIIKIYGMHLFEEAMSVLCKCGHGSFQMVKGKKRLHWLEIDVESKWIEIEAKLQPEILFQLHALARLLHNIFPFRLDSLWLCYSVYGKICIRKWLPVAVVISFGRIYGMLCYVEDQTNK